MRVHVYGEDGSEKERYKLQAQDSSVPVSVVNNNSTHPAQHHTFGKVLLPATSVVVCPCDSLLSQQKSAINTVEEGLAEASGASKYSPTLYFAPPHAGWCLFAELGEFCTEPVYCPYQLLLEEERGPGTTSGTYLV